MAHRSVFILLLLLFPLAICAAPNNLDERVLVSSVGTIAADTELSSRVNELAQHAISEHCSACHGADLHGAIGIPDLLDYDWLWGVTGSEVTTTEAVMEIMQTILYGIRDRDCPAETKSYGACPDTRYSEMPAYGSLGFTPDLISDLVEYTRSLSGLEADSAAVARAAPGAAICTECHGEGAYGYKPYGGPDLTDDVWLYGSSRAQLTDVLNNGRLGTCPPWWDKLDAATIKALSVYLFQQSMGY